MTTKLIKRLSSIAFFAFCVSLSSGVLAEKQRGERRKGPPPEAIEACESLQEGDSVSFETRRGDSIDAQCMFVDDILVAVPKDRKVREQTQ
jgi:hypothetical protein